MESKMTIISNDTTEYTDYFYFQLVARHLPILHVSLVGQLVVKLRKLAQKFAANFLGFIVEMGCWNRMELVFLRMSVNVDIQMITCELCSLNVNYLS